LKYFVQIFKKFFFSSSSLLSYNSKTKSKDSFSDISEASSVSSSHSEISLSKVFLSKIFYFSNINGLSNIVSDTIELKYAF